MNLQSINSAAETTDMHEIALAIALPSWLRPRFRKRLMVPFKRVNSQTAGSGHRECGIDCLVKPPLSEEKPAHVHVTKLPTAFSLVRLGCVTG